MPVQTHKTKVAFSVTNCICYDQRVLKIVETVSSLSCEITIIGRERGDFCSSDTVPFRTRRFKMFFQRGFLFYGFFNIRLFIYLLFHKYDLLVANDLDTLLPNYLVSKLTRIPLVYDSHEFFTEVPELQNRTFVKWFWSAIEKTIFPELKYVMTVSESIASHYEMLYGARPFVIKNLSRNSGHIARYSKEDLGISNDDLLLIIQGTGINIDKGSEELIDALKITSGVTLMIVGSGDVVSGLKLRVIKLGISDKVKFIPTVSWEKLISYTKTADIGLCLEKDTNLNYRYSLPNKLFDYISAGIPVIASNLPETRKIINENGFGIIIESVTPENISLTLSELIANPDRLTELRRNAIATSLRLNWEIESKKVVEFYNKVLICE